MRSLDDSLVTAARPAFHLAIPVDDLAEGLRGPGTTFVIKPCVRFKGEVGEQ